MNALTLRWYDAGQDKTQDIYEQQQSKNPGTVRIGRDPLRCDIVVSNPTVSGLHVEIFFYNQQQCFYIRNLRSQNPPIINGQQLAQGEIPLNEGAVIFLGQMKFQVTRVAIDNGVPATLIVTPQSKPVANPTPPVFSQPPAQHQHHQHHQHHYHPQTPPAPPPGVYGLECPKCHRISSTENLQIGCPWCGTSLAAAISVLVAPK
ncbi:MAG: FHA domain-containing protein [Desmonostoc vinosum HA7617-LM4]|jgi:pSer/pThr/pTyr-binding forkhead associated (FHA) protein|nr:FHA domain-containing protein [Desmonostoc vinosum HA7617-LM4]